MGAIETAVYFHAQYRGYKWIVPELSYGNWFADFICCGPKMGVLEIEIKRTWSDYKADYSKSVARRPTTKPITNRRTWKLTKILIPKSQWLLGSYPCLWRPEYFVYAAPTELAKRIAADPALPKPFGVWSVKEIPAHGTCLEYAHVQSSLKRMRKLVTLTPEQHGRFRNAVFNRSLNIVAQIYDHPIQPIV